MPNAPVANNLVCTGFSNIGGTSAFACVVGVNGTTCGSSEVAAVSCCKLNAVNLTSQYYQDEAFYRLVTQTESHVDL